MAGEDDFGGRLRRARRDAGFSQSELELKSGIPKARLSRYENGHVLPSITTLRKLADALGVSEASLLGDRWAIVEEFFTELFRRGVRIPSAQHARKLADAVADLNESLGLGLEMTPTAEALVAQASVAELEHPPVP